MRRRQPPDRAGQPRKALAESLTGDGAPQVWLKADSGAESVQIIAVMESLRDAGVEHLKLLTLPAAFDGAA